jgi:hypothetical protein
VGARLVEAVEAELSARQMYRGVQTPRELVVGEGVDEGGCLGAGGLGLLRGGRERGGTCVRRHGGRLQHRVPELSRRVCRAGAPALHPFVVQAVRAVHGELDHQRHSLGRALVWHRFEGPQEPVVGLLVLAKEMLDAAAGRCYLPAKRQRVRGDHCDALQQGGVALAEAAGRRQRLRTREQELDALSCRCGVVEQVQCRAEPARRGRRSLQRRLLACLAQDRDRSGVAVARGALDVVRARRGAGTPLRQRLGDPLVCAHSPAARRGLIDSPAHDRMPEAKPARHVGRANEFQPQQHIERVQRLGLRDRRRPGGKIEVERIARHSCPLGPATTRPVGGS